MVIFHSYVSLLEGMLRYVQIEVTRLNQRYPRKLQKISNPNELQFVPDAQIGLVNVWPLCKHQKHMLGLGAGLNCQLVPFFHSQILCTGSVSKENQCKHTEDLPITLALRKDSLGVDKTQHFFCMALHVQLS